MAKQKMVILEAAIDGLGMCLKPGKPYSPVTSSENDGNKVVESIKRTSAGCVIVHTDGTQMEYLHKGMTLLSEPFVEEPSDPEMAEVAGSVT